MRPDLRSHRSWWLTDEGDLVLTAADAIASTLTRPDRDTHGSRRRRHPDPRGVHPLQGPGAPPRAGRRGRRRRRYLGTDRGHVERRNDFDYRAPDRPDEARNDRRRRAAGIDYLRSKAGAPSNRCSPSAFALAAQSWRPVRAQPDLPVPIGFYGIPSRVRDVHPANARATLAAPCRQRQATTQEDFAQFDRELTQAGVLINGGSTRAHAFFFDPASSSTRTPPRRMPGAR